MNQVVSGGELAAGAGTERSALNDVATYQLRDGVALILLDSPPVNALSADVREGLKLGFECAIADDRADAVVLACEGRTFVAGADIREFDDPTPRPPDLREVLKLIETCAKPTIAAIHGTALGGGLELALCCHFRVAVATAKLGLPEVRLGILPGAGGTQRLPRIIGASAALDMIAIGKPVSAGKAAEMGLVDHIVEGDLVEGAVGFARTVAAENRELIRVRDRTEGFSKEHGPEVFNAFREKNARAFRGVLAPAHCIRAVEAAFTMPFEDGIAEEIRLFEELIDSQQSAAQRYLFFAEREAGRIPGLDRKAGVRAVGNIGVIGAGTMGGGIAMNFLDTGIPVTIVERDGAALERGVATIRRNYEMTAAKGRISAEEVERRMSLLSPTTDMASLGNADLVIEAVFENMAIKEEVFNALDGIAKPGAILATNTSFLDVDRIADATSRPADVVGLHFFSPANVMRLLEVVRGAKTSDEVLASAMAIATRIRKLAVVSGVCDGFIANRMMTPRMDAAQALILEGPMPWEIDRAMLEYGFPMGPFAMLDLVGLDVIGWDAATSSSSTPTEVLCEIGRWGQKKGGGFYDYDDRRRPSPSSKAEAVIRRFQTVQKDFTDEQIVERLLFPVVNEGARILEDGIALRASDIDIALAYGYGWPAFTGGPLFWADGIGLDRVVAGLEASGQEPAGLLRDLAANGGKLHRQSPVR